jgi:acyl-coenzyme A thioesterase PaaI-like protein
MTNFSSAPTLSDLNQVLANTAFLQPYGFRVESCAPGECTLRVPFLRSLERPGGIVSGMTLMGAADVAMWLAIMTVRGVAEHWVTSDMKTAFLRGAREEDIVCGARILKPGRRTMYGTAECHGANARLVAHHVITYSRVEA